MKTYTAQQYLADKGWCNSDSGQFDFMGIASELEAFSTPFRDEIKSLQDWKESAMNELNELDLQSLAKKLGIGLGESVSANVHAKVDDLKKRAELAESQLSRYRSVLERISKEPDYMTSIWATEVLIKEALKQQDNETDNARD